MLTAPDLQAAVAAGVITAEQARRLQDFAGPSRRWWPAETGFDDLLIALGIGLVGAALSLIGPWAAAIGFWFAGEFAARRTNLPLPAMVACFGFTAALAGTGIMAVEILEAKPFAVPVGPGVTTLLAAALALIGALVFWRRFRQPFSALVVVGCTTAALTFASDTFAGKWADLANPLLILACGLVSFTGAVALDRRDPGRVGQGGAVGFWLHLAAAPLIAHAVLHLAAALSGDEPGLLDPVYAGAVFALALFFAGAALLLDRPAILLAGFAYVLVALGHGLSRLDFVAVLATNVVLLILAGGAAWLGFRWRTARRAVVRMPDGLSETQRSPPFEA